MGAIRRPGRSRRGWTFGGTALSSPDIIFASALKLWVRATNVTLNGGTISAAADLSGSGNNLQQPAAPNQPTFVASGIGGFPDITYGGNHWLYDSTTDIVTTALTAWVIFKTSTLSAAAEQPFGKGFAVTEWLFAGVSTGKLKFAINTGIATSNSALNDNAPHFAIATWDSTVSSGLVTLNIDGVDQTSTGTTTTTISGGDSIGTGAEISGTPSSVGSQFTGNSPEGGIANVLASASQKASLIAYLKSRTGL